MPYVMGGAGGGGGVGGVGILSLDQIRSMLGGRIRDHLPTPHHPVKRDRFRYNNGKLYYRATAGGRRHNAKWLELTIKDPTIFRSDNSQGSSYHSGWTPEKSGGKKDTDKPDTDIPSLDLDERSIYNDDTDPVPFEGGLTLGPFGSPSMKRVNSIVNSLMHEATKEYTRNIADLRRQQKGDLTKNLRTGLAFDRGAQALNAATRAVGDTQLAKNAQMAQAQLGTRQDIENRLNQTSEGISDTVSGMVSAADDNAADTLMESNLRSGTASDVGFMNAIRAAQGMGAVENAGAIRSAYRQALINQQRDLSDVRRRKPLSRLEIEKQIQDMFLARKLGEAEYASASQNIAGARHQRKLSNKELALKRKQLKLQERELNQSKKLDKDRATVYDILYGTTENVYTPVDTDNDGVPDKSYQETEYGVGRPATVNEAYQMLAAAGYTGQRWRNLANEIFAEQFRQQAANLPGLVFHPFPNVAGQ